MRVRLHYKNSEPTIWFSQMTPDKHPPTPLPCRWPSLVTSRTLTKFQLVWRRLCDVLFRSSSLFERALTAVCALPDYQSGCKFSRLLPRVSQAEITFVSPTSGHQKQHDHVVLEFYLELRDIKSSMKLLGRRLGKPP